MIKKIGVLTSGGDAPGMNAAIRAVVRCSLYHGLEVYGIHDGYLGLLEGKIERLYRKSVSEKMALGGTFLGTARLESFKDVETRREAIKNLKIFGIDALVCIGGDGTYRGALGLSELGLPTSCIPGTIDNDIAGTEFTIGYDTALNTAVEAVDKLRDTSNSHRRCSIIEVMGRNCGDIALGTAMSVGAECVICKETGFNEDEVIELVNKAALSKRHAIIVVAENMIDVNSLERKITESTPFEARSTVLGYIQRGGSPSPRDRMLASEMGVKAVEALLNDETGVCVCVENGQIITKPIIEALNSSSNFITQKYEIFKKLW